MSDIIKVFKAGIRPKKTVYIMARLTEKEKEKIQEIADSLNCSLSNYVRAAVKAVTEEMTKGG